MDSKDKKEGQPVQLLRPVLQPLFSTVDIEVGGKSPKAMQLVFGASRRHVVSTNPFLLDDGSLPEPRELSVFGFSVIPQIYSADDWNALAELVRREALFEFDFGARVLLSVPLQQAIAIPHDAMLSFVDRLQTNAASVGPGNTGQFIQEMSERCKNNSKKTLEFALNFVEKFGNQGGLDGLYVDGTLVGYVQQMAEPIVKFNIGHNTLKIRPREAFSVCIKQSALTEVRSPRSLRLTGLIHGILWMPL